MRVVPARSSEDAAVIRGVGDLLTDVNDIAVDQGEGRAVDETVDERRGRILEDLLLPAGELIRGLRPIVILQGDDKNSLDLLCVCVGVGQTREKGKRAERASPSDVRHSFLQDERDRASDGDQDVRCLNNHPTTPQSSVSFRLRLTSGHDSETGRSRRYLVITQTRIVGSGRWEHNALARWVYSKTVNDS